MKLIRTALPALPPLAWLAEFVPHQSTIVLKHGTLVEVGDDYFVEGAWNGAFVDHNFHQSAAFFGSGGRLLGDELIIVPSASTADYCYFQQRADGGALISNSLPLLLAAIDDTLDPTRRDYLAINNSILSGISAYLPEIPTQRGSVTRLIYRNLCLSRGSFTLEDKPLPTPFARYQDYAAYLANCYAAIADNARDPLRRHPLKIASTQSKGYDSTAVNAIASPRGLDAVFSIERGKGHGKFADQDEAFEVDDSGEEIGRALGFECTFIDRRALKDQLEREHLYYASLHASEDTNMAGINPHIQAPTLLLTGAMGGEITSPWSYYSARFQRKEIGSLQRGDHGGFCLGEVRLTVGFINLPFFSIGARRHEQILNITASAEMDPWRMNNAYDRPIARRIAEEAGVPRALFGQQKKATAMVFTPPLLPMGDALQADYINYLHAAGVMPRWKWRFLPLVRGANRVFWFVSPRQHLWLYYLQRLISRLLRRDFQFPTLWQSLDNAFYSFCVNKRAAEHRQALTEKPRSS